MTTQTLDPEGVAQAARKLLDAKIQTVRELATTRQRLHDARAALTVAEREDASAYNAAERAGWSREELRKLGLDSPTRSLPGRPRGKGNRKASDRPQESASASSTAANEQATTEASS